MDEFLILDFLEEFQKKGIFLSTDNIKQVLSKWGEPQKKFPSILIAGTNGKGSTASFIECILRNTGLKTGLFTSPHLYDVRERIKICGKNISSEDFLKTGLALKEFIKGQGSKLTYFEALTAIAFKYFEEKEIDIAVLEVGLGGRLDATNVVEQILSVITSISYDHEELLGNTLEDIAKEKAGILKKGVPLVCGCDKALFSNVIESICNDLEIKSFLYGRDFCIKEENGKLNFFFGERKLKELTLSLKGNFQHENASLSIASAFILKDMGFKIEEKNIRDGCKNTYWPGRFEILPHSPPILLDAAHNIDGIVKLKESLKKEFRERKIIAIFGVKEVKRYYEMLSMLSTITEVFIFPEVEGLLSPQTLYEISSKLGKKSFISSSAEEALSKAKKVSSSDALILITGSIYLLGSFKFLRNDFPMVNPSP